jgi:hypothetical protein
LKALQAESRELPNTSFQNQSFHADDDVFEHRRGSSGRSNLISLPRELYFDSRRFLIGEAARCFETIPLIKAGLPVWLEIETCGFWPWLFSFGNFHAEKRMTSGIALGGVGGTYQSAKSKVWSAFGWMEQKWQG